MLAERAQREAHIAAGAMKPGPLGRPAADLVEHDTLGIVRRSAVGYQLAVAIVEVLLDFLVELIASTLAPGHSRFSTAIGSMATARRAGMPVATPAAIATTARTVV